jgi:hypothetical protein
MKKILTLVFTLFLVGMFSSFAFARDVKVIKKGNNINSIQQGIKAIAPSTNPVLSDAITAQLTGIKKTIDNENTIIKQINTQTLSVIKLINQTRKNKQKLTVDQNTSANNLLTAISTETAKLVGVKGINILASFGVVKNTKVFSQFTSTDLTTAQNNLNQNIVSLNNISNTYNSLIAILTVAANTTPAAITLPITTGGAVTH